MGKVEREDESEKNEANEVEELDEDGEIVPKDTQKTKEATIKETKAGPPLPKENAEDLVPFPLNRQFKSQHVLSEELKDAIYERVMVKGNSVRNVSAALGVEMNRVAAVVRLKAVEKEWEEQVRRLNQDSLVFWENCPQLLMRKTNSISLEDFYRGYQILQLSDLTHYMFL